MFANHHTAWLVYYWLTFFATYWLCRQVPSGLTKKDDIVGSIIFAMMGFFLWPLALLAYIRSRQ